MGKKVRPNLSLKKPRAKAKNKERLIEHTKRKEKDSATHKKGK